MRSSDIITTRMMITGSDLPLYTSRATMKSLRNEYSIYNDRIVLKCRLPFLPRTFVIAGEDIVTIEVRRSFRIGLAFTVLKLDLADLFEHVALRRRNGFFKEFRFTPENPKEFVERAGEVFRQGHSTRL